MEGYNGNAVDYNLDNVRFSVPSTMHEDFSSNPGWVSSDTNQVAWDAGSQTLHGNQPNTQTSAAYKKVNWDGRTAFLLEWDAKANSIQWSAGITFGLFDSSLNFTSQCIVGDFGVGDGGYIMTLKASGDGGAIAVGEATGWQTGVWYRSSIQYDPTTAKFQMTVRNRVTDQLIIQTNAILAGAFSNVFYLGVSRKHMEGYNGNAVDYNLDNVRFCPGFVKNSDVSGAVTYSGPQTGTVRIVANRITDALTSTHSATTPSVGAYSLTNLPTRTRYALLAFIDSNINGSNDFWEAQAQYIANPLDLYLDESGVNFALSDPDTDDDTLPDWWEMFYFGNIAQSWDDNPDGDKFPNAQELANNTNPTQFDIGPALIWTAVEIGWDSVAGTNYQVQWASKLNTNDWHNLGSPVTGNGTTNTVFDSIRDINSRFYRVTLAP